MARLGGLSKGRDVVEGYIGALPRFNHRNCSVSVTLTAQSVKWG